MTVLSGFWTLQVLLLVLMAHLSTQTMFLNSTDDVCRLFKDGTKLRKAGTCNEWITCNDFKSSESESCSGTEQYFSLSKAKCYKSYDDSYCDTTKICKGASTGYIGDTINCANWYYCDSDNVLGKGACTLGMYFDQTKQQCVYPKDTVCTATYEMCDIVPQDVPFLDENNCNMYFKCSSKNALVSYTCESGKYYNVATGTCVDKKEVVCNKHPLPEDACGTKKLALRNKFVADGATCRGYYYCRDLGSGIPDPDPIYQQCSENYFFNVERQGCMPRESQTCAYDRCDGRTDGFEVAESKGCHEYIECIDGREGTTKSCGTEYFDVAAQKCTETQKNYGACDA
ncbi:peritrophin-48 [Drosophila eugracilis]|uniref:peritrophin-48 n=1 Tax=Drosophila eugracilis TaxID=29029 RepID=UPI0007E65C80|nr:peritrophin-48 [Drosophila eugracilis]